MEATVTDCQNNDVMEQETRSLLDTWAQSGSRSGPTLWQPTGSEVSHFASTLLLTIRSILYRDGPSYFVDRQAAFAPRQHSGNPLGNNGEQWWRKRHDRWPGVAKGFSLWGVAFMRSLIGMHKWIFHGEVVSVLFYLRNYSTDFD
jgi:hypothetical protein